MNIHDEECNIECEECHFENLGWSNVTTAWNTNPKKRSAMTMTVTAFVTSAD
jgi:hypothetical protein